jgi:prepilin-type N-terminal cleavage/methylation domain-containing protein
MRSKNSGFTLVELMVVVIILGLLAAVAIPAFTRYIKRAKTAEAPNNIARIYQAQMTYYQAMTERGSAGFANAATPTPSANPGPSKYPPNIVLWSSDPEWGAIGFSISTGHYFSYSSPRTAGPSSSGDGFSVTATGDLDGDDVNSTFTRVALIVGGEIQSSPIEITAELE